MAKPKLTEKRLDDLVETLPRNRNLLNRVLSDPKKLFKANFVLSKAQASVIDSLSNKDLQFLGEGIKTGIEEGVEIKIGFAGDKPTVAEKSVRIERVCVTVTTEYRYTDSNGNVTTGRKTISKTCRYSVVTHSE